MIIAAALFALALDAPACPRSLQLPDMLLTAGAIGSAVYADFDEDGRTDAAFVTNGSLLTVALARGDGVYEPVWKAKFQQYMFLTAATDTNRDGHVDLVFGQAVLPGAGDGTFREPLRGTPGKFMGTHGVMRDYDKDGILDLIYWGDTDVFSFFHGTGDGGFALAATYHLGGSAGRFPQLGVGDFDGDGNLDLVRSDNIRPGVQLLEIAWNDNALHFTNAVFQGTATWAHVASADVDGDGAEELLSQVGDALYIHSFLNRKLTSTSTPFLQASLSEGRAMENVSVADMNGDGIRDLVFHLFQSVAILAGTGQRRFDAPSISSFVGPEQYVLTDLDGDAIPDIAGTSGSDGLRVIRGADLQRDRVDARIYPIGLQNPLVRMTDLNGDGLQDIVGRDQGGEHVSIAYGTGHGFQLAYGNDYPTGPWYGLPPIVGDFDGDGAPDLLLSGAGDCLVFFGDGKGGFATSSKLKLDAEFAVDAIRDGTGTAIVARKGEAVLLVRISAGRNVSAMTVTTTAGVASVVQDPAGAPAIAVAEGHNIRLFTRRDGAWSESLNSELPTWWDITDIPLVAGDLNGDALVDLVGYASGVTILYATNSGYTLFRPNLLQTSADRIWGSIAIADVDGDRVNDLVVTGRGAGYSGPIVQVMRNAGEGKFTPLVTLNTGKDGGFQVMFADVDGDGTKELIRAAGHGLEVFRNVCASAAPIHVATSPAIEGIPLRMVIQGIPARGDAGYVGVSENGKALVVTPDRDVAATAVVITAPLTAGLHTYTITFADSYLGEWSRELSIVAMPRRLRQRVAPH